MLTLRCLSCLCSARCAACWTLSNITAGNHAQIAECIDSGCMAIIMEALRDDSAPRNIRQEAAWCLSNAITGGSVDQLVGFVDHGVFAALASILGMPPARVVRGGIESLTRILTVGKDLPPGMRVLSDSGATISRDSASDPNPLVAPARAACLNALKHLRDCGDYDDDLAPLVEFFPDDGLEASDQADEEEADDEQDEDGEEDAVETTRRRGGRG